MVDTNHRFGDRSQSASVDEASADSGGQRTLTQRDGVAAGVTAVAGCSGFQGSEGAGEMSGDGDFEVDIDQQESVDVDSWGEGV